MKPNLTNEIRRVKAKLKLFEMEGCDQLLNEIMNFRVNSKNGSNEEIVKLLKSLYQNELRHLLSKQDKYKQAKLDL